MNAAACCCGIYRPAASALRRWYQQRAHIAGPAVTQMRVILYCCVCSCRATSILMMSNHETVRDWLREHVYHLLSALVLVLITWFWCEAPTAIHLLAHFVSCSLPNINTVKLYFYTPAQAAPVFAVSMWSNSAPMRVDVCRCVPMR